MMLFENEGRLIIQPAYRDFSWFPGEILSCGSLKIADF